MKVEKAVLEKAVESLTERAEDCFDAAEAQHAVANEQHASAEKLVVLGQSLEADAANINGELEMLNQRPSYKVPTDLVLPVNDDLPKTKTENKDLPKTNTDLLKTGT